MFTFKEHRNLLKYVRPAPLYLSLVTEKAQNVKIQQ